MWFLTYIPTLEEVRLDVFSMNPAGAPGSDGFGGVFYQHFWDIIKHDVHSSVLQFFRESWILPNLNSNLLVLIPKFLGADRIVDFRPIALANFKFKLITKFKFLHKFLVNFYTLQTKSRPLYFLLCTLMTV